ncbi:Serine/threonine-protein kinase SSN3 [Psilocybe cubensis]|uniref:Protein kinase domain-containing protein n=2 Tax=Psilocybe cubensis TaxID=181762 RepID=A0A8H7XUA8_PSICU|nr:Serine/threonine-protein kinase SSN3 [Psilocybe cubensis]KAH9474755.1 Serine/threonine-protein kinase SSN3 [Psilocybe cubensis]
MPQQTTQSNWPHRAIPKPGPLAREGKTPSLHYRHAAVKTLTHLSSSSFVSFASFASFASSSSSSSASASSSAQSYPLFTVNSPTSPNFKVDLNHTGTSSSRSNSRSRSKSSSSARSGSGSVPSPSAPACTSSSSSSSSSNASSIWGVCSRQHALDTQLRGRTLYSAHPDETPTPKQHAFPSSAGAGAKTSKCDSKGRSKSENTSAIKRKATSKSTRQPRLSRPESPRADKTKSSSDTSQKDSSGSFDYKRSTRPSDIHQRASSRASPHIAPKYLAGEIDVDSNLDVDLSSNWENNGMGNARVRTTADEALDGATLHGGDSLPQSCTSGSESVSPPDHIINTDDEKGSYCPSRADTAKSLRNSSPSEKPAVLSVEYTHRRRVSEVRECGCAETEDLVRILNAHLVGYKNILPPHIVSNAPQTPLPLHGFTQLQGRCIAVRQVRKIGAGNGTARIETVRVVSLSDPESDATPPATSKATDVDMESEIGLRQDSIWVLKRFKTRDVPLADGLRARAQLKSECEVYKRIAEAPKEGKIGFEFIMSLVATTTFHGEHCLLLPLMATDLADVLDNLRTLLPRHDVRRIIAQIATGLATLHSIGVIHNDIKPANILFSPNGIVKLGDFGLSHRTPALAPLHRDSVYTTRAVGTRGYMAPEKICAGGYSYPVDYWALGCVFAEIVGVQERVLRSFEESSDVLTWNEDYVEHEERKKFFKDQGLDEDSLSLLCGLLDPSPQTRFGILELLVHPYFKIDDDISEFDKIREMESDRWMVVDPPKSSKDKQSTHPIDISDPSNDTMYRWINPYGLYVESNV